MNRSMYIQSGELVTILRDKLRIKNKYFRSMRFSLLVFFFLIAFLPMWAGGRYVSSVQRDTLLEKQMNELQNQATILRNHIMTAGYMDTGSSPTVEAELALMATVYNSRIQIINEDFRVVKDTYIVDNDKINISTIVLRCMNGNNQLLYDEERQVIESAVGIYSKDTSNLVGTLYTSLPTQDLEELMSKIGRKQTIFEIFAVVVAIGASLYFSTTIVKPFKKIEQSIDLISTGNMQETISMKGYYETEQITEAFNEMLQRLQESEDSRQEFVSNVSHELKTPITSIKVLADSLLAQDGIPEEMYKEFLADIVTEIDRENDIITSLLALVKMDKSADSLKIAQKNINDLVEAVLKRLRPIAAKKNIELVFESFRPVIADVDEVKFSMVINNLVENAIKYNVLDGWVHISLNADHKYFYLKVSDSGIGIPEELQDKIFDRFYRVDKARARETGGTGLGLAITKSAVLLHRGSIKVYSKEDEGTTFNVRIPLTYIDTDRRNAE